MASASRKRCLPEKKITASKVAELLMQEDSDSEFSSDSDTDNSNPDVLLILTLEHFTSQ